jgi:hypothetical protein
MKGARRASCALAVGVLATSGACARAQSRSAPGDDGTGEQDAPDADVPDAEETTWVEASPGPSDGQDAGEAGAGPLALYDGFEGVAAGGPPDPALWSVVSPDCSGSGTLAVDATQAHTGHQSLRIDGGGGYCDHVFAANSAAIAALGGQVYARIFLRLGAALGAGHVTFLAMKDAADGGGDLRMGGQDMVLIYNRQSDDATLPVLSPTGVGDSVAPAVNEWTCIELHVDEGAGTIDTWVDGREIAGLVENGVPAADVSTEWLSQPWKPSLVDFRIGWESYAGQAMTLWFDDVALASHRIGCGS